MYSLYAEGKCVCKEYVPVQVYFYKFIMNVMKYEYSKVNPRDLVLKLLPSFIM